MSPGALPQDPAATPGRHGRHRDRPGVTSEPSFRRLWLANALDEAGKPVATLGLSVTAVVVLEANAGQMGVLAAMTQGAYLLFALPAGVWVDRARKRRVLVVANVLRALALGAVLAAHLTGTLTMVHLFALAAVLASAGLFVDTAQGALLPLLVGRPRVSEAQSKLQAVNSVVQSAGPGVTGLVLARVAPPLLFGFSAVTSLASALAAARIDAPEQRRDSAGPRPAFWPELLTGVRFTFRQPALRTGALASAANNLGAGMLMTILQSWSQGVDVWGDSGMRKLWSASNVKVYGGGVSEDAFLESLSKLIGDYDRQASSVSSGRGGRSVNQQLHRERILDVADLAAMPKGRAVVLSSGNRPTLIRTQPWMTGPHAEKVKASIAAHDPQASRTIIEAQESVREVAASVDGNGAA